MPKLMSKNQKHPLGASIAVEAAPCHIEALKPPSLHDANESLHTCTAVLGLGQALGLVTVIKVQSTIADAGGSVNDSEVKRTCAVRSQGCRTMLKPHSIYASSGNVPNSYISCW